MEDIIKKSAYQKVQMARDINRPKINDYIDMLFEDFIELKGDRLGGDDKAILGGIGMFHGKPVTVIGHRKGNSLEENLECNFGMPEPEGYRKAIRLMEQAEKFNRPVITFVDTPGAYPGIQAEENGQSVAIARSIARMTSLKVPVITIITGEGNSGGALAIAVANTVFMMENAVYSILSPEGFASILWKDSSKSDKACELMKITAEDLKKYKIIDEIIPEPEGGINKKSKKTFRVIEKMLLNELKKYSNMSGDNLSKIRYQKFRKIDSANGIILKDMTERK